MKPQAPYTLDWKKGRKAKAKRGKASKMYTATTLTRLLRVHHTKSGWVGRIQSRQAVYRTRTGVRFVAAPDPYEPKIIGPCEDSRAARLALEVVLSLEEKL